MLFGQHFNVFPFLFIEVRNELDWMLVVLMMNSFLSTGQAKIFLTFNTIKLVSLIMVFAKGQSVDLVNLLQLMVLHQLSFVVLFRALVTKK